jgi:hypothetical protein
LRATATQQAGEDGERKRFLLAETGEAFAERSTGAASETGSILQKVTDYQATKEVRSLYPLAVAAAIEGTIGEPAVLVETGETFEALAARTAPVSHLNPIGLPDFDVERCATLRSTLPTASGDFPRLDGQSLTKRQFLSIICIQTSDV